MDVEHTGSKLLHIPFQRPQYHSRQIYPYIVVLL